MKLLRLLVFAAGLNSSLAVAEGPVSVEQLKDQIVELENSGALAFQNFKLCKSFEGFGQYQEMPDSRVARGARIFFYYEPVNLFTKRADGTYQKWFTQDMIIRDAKGEVLLEKLAAVEFNYTTKVPVLDVYGINTLSLGELPAGKYEFEAVLHDRLSGKDARQKFAFEIAP